LCLRIPGKIISIDGGKAVVEYPGERRSVLVLDADVSGGDYVLVQGHAVVEKIPKDVAERFFRALRDHD
jgi:hydrogenase maturation factor